jgi:hypothetical protein
MGFRVFKTNVSFTQKRSLVRIQQDYLPHQVLWMPDGYW